MEAFVEALTEDVLNLNPKFDGKIGSFLLGSQEKESTSSPVQNSCSVRYVEDKLIQAFHPPDVVGGGSFEIKRGEPLSDKFTGMIDIVTGELVHGRRSYVLTGETYEGPFCSGNLRHGDGAIVKNLYIPRLSIKESSLPVISSESQFYGSFRNDTPHYGTLVVSSQGLGFTYHGPFSMSKPHGKDGTLVKPTGYKYVGDFINGRFHGNGVEYEEKQIGGGIYKGYFVDGVRQGFGTYSIEKNIKKLQEQRKSCSEKDSGEYLYKGTWYLNQKHGDGEELIHGSELYRGQFHMNQRHGFGSVTFIKKSENNETDADDSSQPSESLSSEEDKEGCNFVVVKAEGQWRAGKPLHGTNGWTLVTKKGDVYSGFASNFTPQGHGIMQYNNKDIYTGQWKDGKRHGEGMFISANGREEYIGQWVDDKISPSIIISKDDGVSRITDLSQILLQNGRDQYDNDLNDSSPHHKQLQLLQKFVDQSLSQSLQHFEKDESSNQADKYASTKWKLNSSISEETDSDCTESCTEATTENEVKDTNCAMEDNKGDDYCYDDNSEIRDKANLINYPNGDTYLGTLCQETNQREGHGVYLSVASGTTYSGNFIADMRHGFGILIHPLGKYCGDFVEDKKEGKGTLILNDTSSYNGEFKNNKFHGRGTLCKKDRVYVGEWENGMKEGDGYETLPDGRVYMGDFHNSKRHGYGTLLSERCGEVEYNGSWLSGLYHGEGLLVRYIKKTQAQESCDHDLQSVGSLCIHNKDQGIPMVRYEGKFYNGLRHGYGTLTNTFEGSVFSGNWRKDEPVSGKWKIKVNGSSYSGEASVFQDDSTNLNDNESVEGLSRHLSSQLFEDLPNQLDEEISIMPQPHGFGTMKYSNGDVYVGNFVRGLRQGAGTCVYARNQERWDGQWFNDKQQKRRSCIANISEISDSLKTDFEDVSFYD